MLSILQKNHSHLASILAQNGNIKIKKIRIHESYYFLERGNPTQQLLCHMEYVHCPQVL